MARRSPSSQERQRDADRSRQSILDAAGAEFAAHGFAGARVAAIAERAGVNKQLISYYFGGKEGLYAELGRQWFAYEASEIQTTDDPTELVRRYVRTNMTQPHGGKLLAWEGLADDGEDDDALMTQQRNGRLRANNEPMRQAQAEGRLDARIDPDMLGLIMLAAANVPSVYPQLVRGICHADSRSPEFVERLADQLGIVMEALITTEPAEPACDQTDRGLEPDKPPGQS